MKTPRYVLRSLALISGLLLTGASTLMPVSAQVAPPPPTLRPEFQRLIGMVANLRPSSADPGEFTIQLGALSSDVTVDSRTMFVPQSVEAQVEGLVEGDYALVTVRHLRKQWLARRVVFDVDPVRPLYLVAGNVVRVSPDGMHLFVKVDNGGRTIVMRISKQARFLGAAATWMDLVKGESVQVLALSRLGWTAYVITTKPPSPDVRPAR